MSVRWKWAAGAGAVILAIPLLLVGFLVLIFDANQYKEQISDAVQSRTGRPLIIDGDLKLAAGMKPRLSAESIRYPNADWASQPWALEVDKAVVSVNLWALLRGDFLVEEIALERPRLWVERNSAGVYNLGAFGFDSGSGTRPQTANTTWLRRLDVSGAEIKDGEINIATPHRHWDVRIDRARAESAGRGQPIAVDFRGAVEETPITASATVANLETLVTFQSSPLSITGWVGDPDNHVRATGHAGDLLTWRDIDLMLDLEVAHTAKLSELAGRKLPNLGIVHGRARLLQPQTLRTLALREIELQSTEWGLHSTFSGEIARVTARAGMDLKLSTLGNLDHTLPGWLTAAAGVDADAQLTVGLTARLSGSAQDMNLRIEEGKLENAGMSARARGTIGFMDGEWRGSLPVSLAFSHSGVAQELPGRALSPIGPLAAEAELIWDRGGWRLNDVKLSLERETLKIKVAGAINELTNRPSGHLYIIAEAEDGRYLQPLFDASLPPLSDLKLEAALDFSTDSLRATVDQLNVRVYGADFSANGTIAELNRLRGIDLAISGRADGLQQLPPLAGRALPHSGPVRAMARFEDDEAGALHLTDITASVAGEPIELAADGEIRNLGASMNADFKVEMTLTTPEPVHELFAESRSARLLDAVIPLKASGNVYSLSATDWGIRDFQATSPEAGSGASFAGEVTAFAPLDASLHADISGMAVSQMPLNWDIPRPRGGTLDMSMDMAARHGEVSIKNILVALDSDTATMLLHGDIDRLDPMAINNMELKFDAPSVAALEWPAAASFNPHNSVSGSVVMVAAGANHSRFAVDVKIGENDVNGSMVWQWPGDGRAVPEVEADLRSERFDFREILAPVTGKTRFFSGATIHTDWIHKLNGRINLTATEAGNHLISLRDVRMMMRLNNGTFRQTVNGRMGQGDVDMSLMVDGTVRPFSAEFKMHGKNLDTEGLVAFQQDHFVDSGTFDSDIEFTASGASMADLATNGGGRVFLRLYDARMKNETLNFVGGDIFTNLVTIINPFRSIGEYINIECGVLRFDIESGVAVSKNGLAMKTDRVTLLGGGDINLNDESLKILISPKARKGFGINPSSLAKFVRLGGTLAKPKIEADNSRLLETGAVVAAAFYSGGLSLIAKGLLDRNQANADVCGLAATAKVENIEATDKTGRGG